MVKITLPSGEIKEFQKNITPLEIATTISTSLAKDSIAAKINGELKDINTPLTTDCKLEIITTKNPEAIEVLRHDCEHLLAQAVKELFPETEVIFGTSGKSEKSAEEFFYDFRRETPFKESDLEKIEKKMLELATKNLEITRTTKPKNEAINFFNLIGEPFKAKIIEEIIKDGEEISLYTQGNFTDLCKGPHYINTKFLRHFKLMRVSGSYWRGDATEWEFAWGTITYEVEKDKPRQNLACYYIKNGKRVHEDDDGKFFYTVQECYEHAKKNGYSGTYPVLDSFDQIMENVAKNQQYYNDGNGNMKFEWKPNLQRITGTAFFGKKELEDYLTMLAEAEKRDHRKLGRELELFHISEEAVGSVFWHKNGWYVYRTIQEYIRQKQEKNGYIEVRTPQLINRELWEKSGHWEKYQENMFICEDEKHTFALKPMNCPAHIEIFKQGLKSYKDLPIRMAEFGSCHRNEPSGSLHGIMRVRAFTQDDAHIFCTEDQIVKETKDFCTFLHEVYKDFGFTKVEIKLSTRPEKRAGTDETWDRAEQGLAEAIKLAGYDFEIMEGEGAFYGPKLEFQLTDAIGRKWQCGTIQLDFVLPERLNAQYVTADGTKKYAVILHRAILGSFERFIGILIENFAGKLPLWISPTHVAICSISQENEGFAKSIAEKLQENGIIAELDTGSDTISYKVRKYSNQKVPYIISIGKKEQETGQISIRILGSEKNHTMTAEEFVLKFKKLVQEKSEAYNLT